MMLSPSMFTLAYALDWLIGDPRWLPHPVRWMGWTIRLGESALRRFVYKPRGEFVAGLLLTVSVIGTFGVGSWLVLHWLQGSNPIFAFSISIFLAVSTLATRSLLEEAHAVLRLLLNEDLVSARAQVARIVGRDTEHLSEAEVTRAAIETLAESASDGIVAPLFYLAIGGIPAALAYKAANTLDSMIGHRGEPYEFFGKCAARVDDVASFIPARITALLLVCAAWTLRLNWQSAWSILRRDGGKHKSPNAGRPEAAMAGALGVRLGGLNFYNGEAHDGQYLGDALFPLDPHALQSALRMTIAVSVLMFAFCLIVRLLIFRG
jgi:adenosylcobinamide-phosphate synthase